MKSHDEKLKLCLKAKKVLLYQNLVTKISNKISETIQIENVADYYQISKLFNMSNISKLTLKYMERNFTMVVDTENFLQLDFNIVKTLLASSSLNIDTEVEVFEAAVAWLNYNFDERSKHSKDLLLKVRFPLLSEAVLKSLITPNSSLRKINNYRKIIKSLIEGRHHDFKDNLYKHKNKNYYIIRYCNQNMFDIFTRRGLMEDNMINENGSSVQLLDGNNLKSVKPIPLYKTKRSINK